MNLGHSSVPSTLYFSVILDQKTGKLILREGNLLTLEIPKHWQKPDLDTKNPALWVCHLPENSLGIVQVGFYPTELEIKKKMSDKNDTLIYRGTLEITSENENQIFYHCQLKLLEEEKKASGALWFLLIFILIVAAGVMLINLNSQN